MARSFQQMVLLIATITLVIAIIFAIIAVLFMKGKAQFPPVVGECPDYFESKLENGKAVCKNIHNLGSCGAEMSFTGPQFEGPTRACALSQWAKKCNITWDGITNQDVCK